MSTAKRGRLDEPDWIPSARFSLVQRAIDEGSDTKRLIGQARPKRSCSATSSTRTCCSSIRSFLAGATALRGGEPNGRAQASRHRDDDHRRCDRDVRAAHVMRAS